MAGALPAARSMGSLPACEQASQRVLGCERRTGASALVPSRRPGQAVTNRVAGSRVRAGVQKSPDAVQVASSHCPMERGLAILERA